MKTTLQRLVRIMTASIEQTLTDWPELKRERRALVVVDVFESVRLMLADEEDTVRRWQSFVADVGQRLLPLHHGKLVKSLGDGLLLGFEETGHAVDCALALQDSAAARNAGLPSARQMRLRIGVHAAEVVVDVLDVYGAGVNLTARLASLAEPGQIVISAEGRDELTDGLDAEFHDLGERFVKHLTEPVRCFAVTRLSLHRQEPEQPASADLRPTIAVVPFHPTDADALTQVASDVIADEVIFALSVADSLNVISRLSTAAFKNRDTPLAEVASALGATYVLSGRIFSRSRRIGVQVELADVNSGTIVWSQDLRCSARDVCQPGAQIVRDIVSGVATAIVNRELTRARFQPLSTLRSCNLLFAAVSLMHRAVTVDVQRAKEMLEHLAEREARHSRPHAWLANWYALAVTQQQSADRQHDVAHALDHARRALDRDPQCALALAIDGVIQVNLLRDLDRGHSRLDAAVQANPNEGLGWLFKGVVHAFKGEGSAARAASDRALALSPLDPMRHYYESLAASAALGDRDYPRAIRLATRSLRGNRTHPSTFRALAIAHAMSASSNAARRAGEELLQVTPGYTVSEFQRSSGFGLGPLKDDFSAALRAAGIPA